MMVIELIEVLRTVDLTKPVLIEMDDEKSEIGAYEELPDGFVLCGLDLP